MSSYPPDNPVSTRLLRTAGSAVMVSPGAAGRDPIPQDLSDRFVLVLQLTGPKLPGHLREQFMSMLTPLAMGIMGGTLAVWAVSHFFGVGFVVDALFVVAGVLTMGYTAFQVGKHLGLALRYTRDATTRAELDNAAGEMAEVIILIGVEAFLALLTKGAGKVAKGSRAAEAEAGAGKAQRAAAKSAEAESAASKSASAGVHVADDVLRLYAKEVGIAASSPREARNLREALRYFAEFEQNPTLLKGAVDPAVVSKIKAINLAEDVEILTLKRGTKLKQWSDMTELRKAEAANPGSLEPWNPKSPSTRLSRSGVGEFNVKGGVKPQNVGVAPGLRQKRTFMLDQDVTVLKSKAGPFGDNWTRGRVVPEEVWPTQTVSRASLPQPPSGSTAPGGQIWKNTGSGVEFNPSLAGRSADSISRRAIQQVPGGSIQYYLPERLWTRLVESGGVHEFLSGARTR